jgi:hypothetical protein
MSSGGCLTSKLYDKIIKRPSISHETIPLNVSLRWSRSSKASFALIFEFALNKPKKGIVVKRIWCSSLFHWIDTVLSSL